MGDKQIGFLKGVLAGFIIAFVLVLIIKKPTEKPSYDSYINKIRHQEQIIDSILSEIDDSVVIRYEDRVEIIYRERDEKISNVTELSADDKLLFFTEWLSEMDSLR